MLCFLLLNHGNPGYSWLLGKVVLFLHHLQSCGRVIEINVYGCGVMLTWIACWVIFDQIRNHRKVTSWDKIQSGYQIRKNNIMKCGHVGKGKSPPLELGVVILSNNSCVSPGGTQWKLHMKLSWSRHFFLQVISPHILVPTE